MNSNASTIPSLDPLGTLEIFYNNNFSTTYVRALRFDTITQITTDFTITIDGNAKILATSKNQDCLLVLNDYT